jgi:hypothetical protein
MPKIQYETIALRTKAVAFIEVINRVIENYQRQGYQITLRQLYYRCVAKKLFPDDQKFSRIPGTNKWKRDPKGTFNCQPNYDWLGITVSNGRRAGLIDWEAIVDRTRFLRPASTWETPAGILGVAANQFEVDRWKDQTSYVELWFEKDALLNVFERASENKQLPIFSNRGYVSDSAVWEAAQRIIRLTEGGRKAHILHFGDHDPSGIDMTRDVEARLNLFGAEPTIHRLALNMDQVKKYDPPPDPAKQADSRYADYVKNFGTECWELDALEPDVLVKLVDNRVARWIDVKKWKACLAREEEGKLDLGTVARHWERVLPFANNLGRVTTAE